MRERRAEPTPAAARSGGEGLDLVERLRRIHRENERLFERLVDGEHRFRALARAVWEVQEQERRRVAHELHDGLGQTLTALKMRLEGLGGRASTAAPELSAEIAKTIDLASQALGEARRLAHLLRPQMLDDLGLYPALRWLARTLGEWTGFEVRLELLGDVPGVLDGGRRLDPELETLAFRVVQEGLTNAMKHSGAVEAAVRVEHRDGELRIEVSDRGCGFDPLQVLAASEATAGFGLQGMRDRVELTGGRLDLHSRPGEGTRLTAELPATPAETGGGGPG